MAWYIWLFWGDSPMGSRRCAFRMRRTRLRARRRIPHASELSLPENPKTSPGSAYVRVHPWDEYPFCTARDEIRGTIAHNHRLDRRRQVWGDEFSRLADIRLSRMPLHTFRHVEPRRHESRYNPGAYAREQEEAASGRGGGDITKERCA
jgi:hypothetical protein